MPGHACRGQRRICGNQLSLCSVETGARTQVVWLPGSFLYPLNPNFDFLFGNILKGSIKN